MPVPGSDAEPGSGSGAEGGGRFRIDLDEACMYGKRSSMLSTTREVGTRGAGPSVWLVFGMALLSAGCGIVLREPVPNLEPDWHHRTWRVHCETARSHPPDPEAPPGAHHATWIWARDDDGREIALDGRLEDGFLVVSGMHRDGDATVAEEPPTLAWLRDRCLDTLLRHENDESLELGRVTAARHGENVDATIVLPAEDRASSSIRRVVIFGDSLSDTGLLRHRLRVMPGPPYWLGRFSNGPVWVDYVEAGAGLAVQNHAYGGASITHHEHVPGDGLLHRIKEGGQYFLTGSIGHQIENYLARTLPDRTIRRPEETAFVIWAGANEYISKEPISNVITTFLNSPGQQAGYRRVADEAVAALEDQVRALHEAGARKFVLINLPDLGHTPIVLQNKTYLPAEPVDSEAGRRLELAWRLSDLTAYHNRAVSDAVARLRSELPDASILELDSSDFVSVLVGEPVRGRSGEPVDPGFDLDARRVALTYADRSRSFHGPCYDGGYLGTSHADRVCRDEANAVFWDVVHPTSYAHCWQAWFFERALAEAGWLDDPRSPELHREWCRTVSERTRGTDRSGWMLEGDPP